jgi:hypothetical protein
MFDELFAAFSTHPLPALCAVEAVVIVSLASASAWLYRSNREAHRVKDAEIAHLYAEKQRCVAAVQKDKDDLATRLGGKIDDLNEKRVVEQAEYAKGLREILNEDVRSVTALAASVEAMRELVRAAESAARRAEAKAEHVLVAFQSRGGA